jgi:hypothetical protein
MTRVATYIVCAGAILTTASAALLPAHATEEGAVENYSCKEIMRENGVNRNTAIAFLHGFLLGKSGGSKFSIEALTKQTDAFIDHCLDNPAAKAVEVMTKIKR